jgi:hypothetical protein
LTSRAWTIVGALAIVACSRSRYHRDVEAICGAPLVPATSNAGSWRAIDEAIAAVEPTLQTPDGRRLVARLRDSGADPAAILAKEASAAGVAPCPLASTMAIAEEEVRYRHDVTMLCGYELDELRDEHFLAEEGRRLRDRLAALAPSQRRAALLLEAKRLGHTMCAVAEAKP